MSRTRPPRREHRSAPAAQQASFNITSGFPTTAFSTGAEVGGTSGIIVDDVSTNGQASSLYYPTLSDGAKCVTGGCAVKRTQAGLQ